MLKLENINLSFENFELKDVSLHVHEGDYFVILGLSGAGKSLMLECISGIKKIKSGKIILDGKDITNHKIQDRNVGYVFQDHAVFPHMDVFDNIAYSIKKKFTKTEVKQKVEEITELVNISHLLHRDTKTLSGGEAQRVALARTLIRDPKCILLDEPFSSLDVQLRDDLRSLLRKINRLGKTIIHVTHDYEEAVTLAKKVAVFQKGRLIQEGIPSEVFANPKSAFIARFKGIRNFFEGKMIANDKLKMDGGVEIQILPQEKQSTGYILLKSQDVIVSIENFESSICNVFKGKISDIIPSFKGNEIIIEAEIKLTAFISHQSLSKLELKIGDTVWAGFKASALTFLPNDD